MVRMCYIIHSFTIVLSPHFDANDNKNYACLIDNFI